MAYDAKGRSLKSTGDETVVSAQAMLRMPGPCRRPEGHGRSAALFTGHNALVDQ